MAASKDQIMREAVELAKKARGQTAPNPMVGAIVLSKDGEVLGTGYHVKAGAPHAEVVAIRQALEKGADLKDATLFVTLEPCNHFGKTPPCTDLILSSGIKKVYFGAIDPNPLMRGKSGERLRSQGVQVESGLLMDDCEKLIRGFRSVVDKKRPFVTLKCATSLDGKIATSAGESQWITDEPARQMGHVERSEHDAILVGVGTVLADDPQLTVRDSDLRNSEGTRPIRKVVLDSQLRTPPTAKIFASRDQVLIYCGWNYSEDRKKVLENAGAVVIPLSSPNAEKFSQETLGLKNVLEDLALRGVQEILVEGGARVMGTFVKEKLFDRIIYFIAPKILGSESRDVFEGLQVATLKESIGLENLTTRLVGKDVVIEGVIEGIRECSPA